MFNKSYTLGRVFGIPIKVHSSVILIVILISMLNPSLSLLDVVSLAFVILASVTLHELGHSWVAMRKGCYVHEIVLSPLGGVAKMMNLSTKPMDEILIAAAGPAVSLALAVPFTALYFKIDNSFFIAGIAGINTMLFLFNILPVFPMDGGRVLRAAISIKHGRLTGTRIAVLIGKYFCLGFVVIGLWKLSNVMLAVIGYYIYRAGQAEYRMVQQEYQASPWRGQQEGRIDVEVSPPPYEEAPKWKFWK